MSTCLKKRLYGSASGVQNDALLGSALVLLQWNWPRETNTFLFITDCLTKKSCFTFKLFFEYIVNVDILEEFAYLWKHHPNVTLDLMPVSQVEIASKRALTRGVKQNVSEDFKQAMIRQVVLSGSDVEKLVQKLIMTETEMFKLALT